MEAGIRAVQRIGSRAKLIDGPRRPDHRLKNRLEERAVLAYAIDVGGNADKFALRVIFNVASVAPVDRAVDVEDRRHQPVLVDAFGIPDDIVFGLFDQSGPKQGERLRGAVANPDAVVVARTWLEGGARRVDEDKRRLGLDGVADFLVANCDPSWSELLPPHPGDLVAKSAEVPVRVWRYAVPHRRGADECDAVAGLRGKRRTRRRR